MPIYKNTKKKGNHWKKETCENGMNLYFFNLLLNIEMRSFTPFNPSVYPSGFYPLRWISAFRDFLTSQFIVSTYFRDSVTLYSHKYILVLRN